MTYTPDKLELEALLDFPMVQDGDCIAGQIASVMRANNLRFLDHDVLCVAQKVISKAEKRAVLLSDVTPSDAALRLAKETGKDPALAELILRESTRIIRQSDNLIITEHKLGMVMANAGIDRSNIKDGYALLLPEDPDGSAREIHEYIRNHHGVHVGVIITDSIGRAWRNGITGHAIGVAGITALVDLQQTLDLNDRELLVTEVAVADEIAAAASLLMGQGAEGKPVVLVRGFSQIDGNATAAELLRPIERDLFR